jgi:hypothetical protein
MARQQAASGSDGGFSRVGEVTLAALNADAADEGELVVWLEEVVLLLLLLRQRDQLGGGDGVRLSK